MKEGDIVLAPFTQADGQIKKRPAVVQSLPLPPAMTEHEFDAELEKRGREIRQGKAKGEPVEKVIAELREKFL